MTNEYFLPWAIYLLAVVSAQLLLWKIVSGLKYRELSTIIQLMLFSILIVPAPLSGQVEGQSYWAPSFMAALMEGINFGFEAALPRLWPIGITMMILICLSLAWTLYRSRRAAKQASQ